MYWSVDVSKSCSGMEFHVEMKLLSNRASQYLWESGFKPQHEDQLPEPSVLQVAENTLVSKQVDNPEKWCDFFLFHHLCLPEAVSLSCLPLRKIKAMAVIESFMVMTNVRKFSYRRWGTELAIPAT